VPHLRGVQPESAVTPAEELADESKFRAIYDDHYEMVSGYVSRRIDNHSDVEEIVNSVFRVAWQRLDRVPHEPDTRRWLLWVARRTISNQLRGGQRRLRLIQRIATMRVGDVVVAPLADAESDDLPVRRAFNRLRPSEQEVLRLVIWDGLSHGEAAYILRCSVNTFDVRFHRARVALRAALEAEDHDV
jgi:RNA polymerase sigma factor (sigma-70 family)